MGFDPCSEIRKEVDASMNKLRDAASVITGPLNAAKSEALNMVSNNEDINALQSEMSTASGAAMTEVNDLTGGIEDFTGDCLTPIINKIKGIISGADQFVSDIFNAISSQLLSFFSKLFDLINIINLSGISSLIGSLDEMLGCLASSCVNQELQGIFDEIDSIIGSIGLLNTGNFDLNHWLEEMIPDVAEIVGEKITIIKDIVTETANTAKTQAQAAAATLKVPKEYY